MFILKYTIHMSQYITCCTSVTLHDLSLYERTECYMLPW